MDKINTDEFNAENIANNKLIVKPQLYLFTDAEKEILQNIVPNKYLYNLNEKYNQKKKENILKSQINVLNSDIEFELKKNLMISHIQRKKQNSIITINIERLDYSKKLRNNFLNNTKSKYNAKKDLYVNTRSYNIIKKEEDEQYEDENNEHEQEEQYEDESYENGGDNNK